MKHPASSFACDTDSARQRRFRAAAPGKYLLAPLLCVLVLIGLSPASLSDPPTSSQSDQDVCRRNLRLIYDAIQRYRTRNKKLPDRLSDLFPAYLGSQDYLVCPAARRRGLTSAGAVLRPDFSDPLTSYFYEFSPIELAGFSGQTQRSWKQRQMGLLGSAVPMVRCVGLHATNLNLSFGGEVYESGLYWEDKFAQVVRPDDLAPGALFHDDMTFRVVVVPPRPPEATPGQIDLSDFYNASLTKSWNSGDAANHLAALPAGLDRFGGVVFDVRGVIQLRAENSDLAEFPKAVHGIPIRQKCHRLHFLQSASYTAPLGTVIARYRFHFTNHESLEMAVTYGSELVDWWAEMKPGPQPPASHLIWTGENESSRRQGKSLHLYESTWENPWPDVAVTSADFISTLSASGAFLVALTAEP
jgi:hypothetical protein